MICVGTVVAVLHSSREELCASAADLIRSYTENVAYQVSFISMKKMCSSHTVCLADFSSTYGAVGDIVAKYTCRLPAERRQCAAPALRQNGAPCDLRRV